MKTQEIYKLLNQIAPFELAYDFDNVGLLIGDYQQEVSKIMLALDATPEVVEQAIAEEVQLLITHHPIIFKPMSSITTSTPTGDIVFKLIKNNISVISMHTNLDIAANGVNDVLAKLAGLNNILTIAERSLKSFLKLSFFVPQAHTTQIVEVIENLHIQLFGNYESCFFTTAGVGRFKPLDSASPFIGTVQELTETVEDKIEMLIPKDRCSEIITKIKAIHPYEEMAYELSAIEQPDKSIGIVRTGELHQPMSAQDFATIIKQKMNLDGILVTLPHKRIHKVAVCGGTGADFIQIAKKAGVDALLTGDIKYHEAQLAENIGLAILAIGHQESEQPVMMHLMDTLQQKLPKGSIEFILAKQSKTIYFM